MISFYNFLLGPGLTIFYVMGGLLASAGLVGGIICLWLIGRRTKQQ